MKHKKNLGHHVFLSSYCIIVVIPFVWLILGALKTRQEWMVNPAGLPKYFAIENLLSEDYIDNIRINAFGSRFYEPAPKISFMSGLKLNL